MSIKKFFGLSEVFGYYFRKKDPDRPTSTNLKIMHGINRIAILVFLASLIFFLLKKFL